MGLTTIAAPEVEPVTLDEMKRFLVIDADDTRNDADLTDLTLAARQWVEKFLRRRLITQTVRMTCDFFPGYIDPRLTNSRIASPFVSTANALLAGLQYALILPYPPVQEIVAFHYLTSNGNSVDLTEGVDYTADLESQPARLLPFFGKLWPVARITANAVTLDYKCGYGDTAAEVPALIRSYIKRIAANWYEHRLADENDLPPGVKAGLYSFRDLRF